MTILTALRLFCLMAMSTSETIYRTAASGSVGMASRTREEDLSLSSVSCTMITSLSVSQNVA
jgi:hypothetical protein